MFVSSLSSLPLLCFVPTTGTHFWRFLSSLLSLQRQRTPCFGVVEVVSLPLVSLISFVGIFDFEVFSYHYSFDVRNPFLVFVVIHCFFFLNGLEHCWYNSHLSIFIDVGCGHCFLGCVDFFYRQRIWRM